MHKTVVINVVGLSPALIGAHTPRISALAAAGATARVNPVLPAVTCSVQSSYLTGAWPDEHGIVGNGWYFREEAEVRFWRQSNRLVQKPSVWDLAKQIDPKMTAANLFWWYNMYSSADYSVTPRPMYPADGRKLPDIHTHPLPMRDDLQRKLGQFPLFKFWGPASSIDSSTWITSAAIEVDRTHRPTLTLVYLPHLDYCLQKLGPDDPAIAAELRAVDAEVGRLLDHFAGANILLLSEYGISPVSRPVHINRALRENNLIRIRDELGRELLDCGASLAFAVADHQVAHIYVNDSRVLEETRKIVAALRGVARVYVGDQRREIHLNHDRAGDIIAIAEPDAWFTYYYWFDDRSAPDFARTVDIHRKPGYDPVELFLDPTISRPKLKIAGKLLRKKLGMRYLMDVIPLDASLVKGSHGAPPISAEAGPVLITNRAELVTKAAYEAPEVCRLILDHLQRA
ncbi:MAG: alkaline phosphatase family protein [Burkholderiales bacterium]|nr:alkaline phosphatase family protein [Phycisphaerae bacterium]